MKKWLLIFLIVFGITIFNFCFGFELETHNFEGWDNDTKLNLVEPTWFWSDDARISILDSYNGTNSFYAHGGEVYTTGFSFYIPVPTTTQGGFSVWFKLWASSSSWTNKWGIGVLTGAWLPWKAQWSLNSNEWIGNELEVRVVTATHTIEMGTWKNIEVHWLFEDETLKIRYRINDELTDWIIVSSYSTSTPNWINLTNLDNSAGKVYWDYIEIWDNSEMGGCGRLSGCIYCKTKSECLEQSCTWFYNPFSDSEFCFYGEASTTIFQETSTQFLPFYNNYSQWETPTEMVSKLASTTSYFFTLISGVLNTFNSKYNNTSAQTYGTQYGLAIPKIRGYAESFNNLIGINLPIGEIGLIYLTILVIIIIFRLIRILIKIIPFS